MKPFTLCFALTVLCLLAIPAAWPAPFGTVVAIGGHVSDIALDERRGLLYAANYSAGRVEVISTADNRLRAPLAMVPQAASLALSPDGRYLVVAQRGFLAGVTILDLESSQMRSLALEGAAPLTVAFGAGARALVVTSKDLRLLDPATGAFQVLQLAAFDTKNLPVKFHTFPPEILQASAGVSGDGRVIYVLVEGGATSTPATTTPSPTTPAPAPTITPTGPVVVRLDVVTGELRLVGVKASPPLGPRLISVDQDGGKFIAG